MVEDSLRSAMGLENHWVKQMKKRTDYGIPRMRSRAMRLGPADCRRKGKGLLCCAEIKNGRLWHITFLTVPIRQACRKGTSALLVGIGWCSKHRCNAMPSACPDDRQSRPLPGRAKGFAPPTLPAGSRPPPAQTYRLQNIPQ